MTVLLLRHTTNEIRLKELVLLSFVKRIFRGRIQEQTTTG